MTHRVIGIRSLERMNLKYRTLNVAAWRRISESNAGTWIRKVLPPWMSSTPMGSYEATSCRGGFCPGNPGVQLCFFLVGEPWVSKTWRFSPGNPKALEVLRFMRSPKAKRVPLNLQRISKLWRVYVDVYRINMNHMKIHWIGLPSEISAESQ